MYTSLIERKKLVGYTCKPRVISYIHNRLKKFRKNIKYLLGTLNLECWCLLMWKTYILFSLRLNPFIYLFIYLYYHYLTKWNLNLPLQLWPKNAVARILLLLRSSLWVACWKKWLENSCWVLFLRHNFEWNPRQISN